MSTNKPGYTISNESITVVLKGQTYTVKQESPNFVGLKKALVFEDWEAVPGYLTIARSITAWAQGRFALNADNTRFLYGDVELPQELNERIFAMVSKNESPEPLFRFWEKAMLNPSYRSRTQLFAFLTHRGIPICEDGDFLAYKGVKQDYKDCHSGTFDNHVGQRNFMDRTLVSDDPEVACDQGLHVGALSYASNFAPRDGHIMVCKINPKDVVSVPRDSSQEKMRVCDYVVYAHHGSQLSSTVHKEDATPKKAVKDTGKPVSVPSYEALDKLDHEALLKENTDVLRGYAANHLKVTGASKIPGGKHALVEKILEVRGK